MEPGLADVPLFTNGARDTVTERQTDADRLWDRDRHWDTDGT